MPKTKNQKIKAVEEGIAALNRSDNLILVDFTGLSVNKINELRGQIRAGGGIFKVIKKRLLKIIFDKQGVPFDPNKFEGQTGIVFSPKDISETSSLVYKFSQSEAGPPSAEKKSLKILGGFNVKAKNFIESDFIIKLGSLPSREVLLAQFVGLLASPIRMFLYVLKEKSQMVETK